ncbi:hypothetical protein TSUD_40590 [Trifolium subterraneum]|uniref:Ubiquitin thioesterase OTU n=2 Tax=Trifolium TaxID=3898 RepID=A0A2Z6N800_TRISU|nr:hypothetical protein TSUD_40590 [Trifolium subterraneum]
MLGVLCATRSRPWIFSFLHSSSHHNHTARLAHATVSASSLCPTFSARRNHSSQCKLQISTGGAASIWHAIMPCGGDGLQQGGFMVHHDHELKGEGSWNVAWDARPARWLHRSDSAWLLFGVCACLAPPVDVEAEVPPLTTSVISPDENYKRREIKDIKDAESDKPSDELSSEADYRVTGVLADGRCLFRAIAHGACLKNGEEAPNENRQRELADELRAKVAEELLKRRKETEWFIEGDFDTYVTRIQQTFVWGGEPELLMASHVLK